MQTHLDDSPWEENSRYWFPAHCPRERVKQPTWGGGWRGEGGERGRGNGKEERERKKKERREEKMERREGRLLHRESNNPVNYEKQTTYWRVCLLREPAAPWKPRWGWRGLQTVWLQTRQWWAWDERHWYTARGKREESDTLKIRVILNQQPSITSTAMSY